jgi:hypothetical protein
MVLIWKETDFVAHLKMRPESVFYHSPLLKLAGEWRVREDVINDFVVEPPVCGILTRAQVTFVRLEPHIETHFLHDSTEVLYLRTFLFRVLLFLVALFVANCVAIWLKVGCVAVRASSREFTSMLYFGLSIALVIQSLREGRQKLSSCGENY